jgi:Tn3 transposase DDE domain
MTGTADKQAYVMCVLEQFHQLLRRREIYAPSSTRWGDPRARLLAGDRWELARPAALTRPGSSGPALGRDAARVAASIHTGEVLASQVMRILQRDGTLTPLGDAFAHYGRIFKTRHLLTYIDDPGCRRDIKGIRNLQEGRHSLAKHVCHGKQGEIHRRYQQGMEEQLGALGLVLNCVTLWNTAYMDAALTQLRTTGYPVLDDDVARLSPFLRNHINVHGTYTFTLPELAGGMRTLRAPAPPTKTTDGRGCSQARPQ